MAEEQAVSRDTIRAAWALALCGFLPFAALAFALFLTGRGSALTGLLADAFKMWSAILLSFLAGIRFGMVLDKAGMQPRQMAIPAAPSVVGWLSLFLPDVFCLPVLMVAYCAQGAWDSISAFRGEAPVWYGNLRIAMTLLVAAAHAVALAAIY